MLRGEKFLCSGAAGAEQCGYGDLHSVRTPNTQNPQAEDCGRITGNSEVVHVGENALVWVGQKGPITAFFRAISGVECGLYHLVSMSCVTLPK